MKTPIPDELENNQYKPTISTKNHEENFNENNAFLLNENNKVFILNLDTTDI